MSKDQYTRLFKYLEEFRQSVDKRLDEAERDRNDIRAAVAELAGDLRDYHQELILTSRKVDRLERWILQVAQESGIKLDLSEV